MVKSGKWSSCDWSGTGTGTGMGAADVGMHPAGICVMGARPSGVCVTGMPPSGKAAAGPAATEAGTNTKMLIEVSFNHYDAGGQNKIMQKTWTETLAYGYSSENTQQDLSNEYQHDRVSMVFLHLCVLVLCMIDASALENLNTYTAFK